MRAKFRINFVKIGNDIFSRIIQIKKNYRNKLFESIKTRMIYNIEHCQLEVFQFKHWK